jgi:L-fucose isomerase-like protein
LKIYIAAFNGIAYDQIDSAIDRFVKKFVVVVADDFVREEPDVIWFLTGGSEHNALRQIESKNRYCLIASSLDNSWAAATEVKALLNEKGISTKIFDYDKLETLSPLFDYLRKEDSGRPTKLGLIGKSADWLVASIPKKDLLKEVLNIDVCEYSHSDLNQTVSESSDESFSKMFINHEFETKTETARYSAQLQSFINNHKLDAIAIDCFSIIEDSNFTACLPVAVLNNLNIPAACEGDLCSAAGMIVLHRLTGFVPWMANLNHVTHDYAEFSHCTAPEYLLEGFTIDTHYETSKGAAIKAKLKKQLVTVFRIDHNLEHCFLSLGEVLETDLMQNACRTQAKIKMSTKSLFLLREFPLGNHHLIAPGDHTDILAEYFTNKGFRIV